MVDIIGSGFGAGRERSGGDPCVGNTVVVGGGFPIVCFVTVDGRGVGVVGGGSTIVVVVTVDVGGIVVVGGVTVVVSGATVGGGTVGVDGEDSTMSVGPTSTSVTVTLPEAVSTVVDVSVATVSLPTFVGVVSVSGIRVGATDVVDRVVSASVTAADSVIF
ncbi:MAG: hypothetical protein KTV16_12355 [Acidimicrobiia bacterium]|nr:hypothetical protein [Acidimicrobiia bacterium]